MIGRIAEHVVHHHRVGHRRENRAEAVFPVQTLIDERHRLAHRALARAALGNRPSTARSTGIDDTEKAEPADVLMRRARRHAGVHRCAALNSSSMRTRRGLRASGRLALSTSSGTMTVRAQYDTFDRWNGNHIGSSVISTGIIGTARHDTTPKSASWMRVKHVHGFRAAVRENRASGARTMCSASHGIADHLQREVRLRRSR